MIPSDFYLLKRFEAMQVEKNGILVDNLVKPGTNLATFAKLFDTSWGWAEPSSAISWVRI